MRTATVLSVVMAGVAAGQPLIDGDVVYTVRVTSTTDSSRFSDSFITLPEVDASETELRFTRDEPWTREFRDRQGTLMAEMRAADMGMSMNGSSATTLGTLTGLSLVIGENLAAGGSASAGIAFSFDAATDVRIDVTSATIDFATLAEGTAFGSAGITLTEPAGGAGASLDGLFGDRSSRAAVDGQGFDLVENLISATTSTTSEGTLAPTAVSDAGFLQTSFSFTLLNSDSVSGTADFVVVPAPTGAAAPGLAAARRR